MKPNSQHIKKFLLLCIAFAACMGIPSHARTVYTPSQVPDVHRTDGSRYVSDPESILSPAAVTRLNTIASQLERAEGIETAIVAVPSIGNDTPEGFSNRLFQLWGIGKKGSDNGLLILLATEDRLVRFEVGYGLEGTLTDALSKRIQTQRMNPYFKDGNWDNGLIAGMLAVQELLTDPESSLLAEQPDTTARDVTRALIISFLAMAAIMALALVAHRRAQKCPVCGAQMREVEESSRRISPGTKVITTLLRCPKCGHTKTKSRTESIGRAITAGTIIGGMGGLGGGGGRTPGGWGGGRSGGGGATSRF